MRPSHRVSPATVPCNSPPSPRTRHPGCSVYACAHRTSRPSSNIPPLSCPLVDVCIRSTGSTAGSFCVSLPVLQAHRVGLVVRRRAH
ncbi:hypothetical protein OH76DRAFT_1409416 [Lentinus brumalis]|uniref:Uncharacterized protein n=1 Tax=Lentinus brumalis TaxID=2498619 RepID=A0A371CV56_9APHY|nr:hypothetical protein OH76DRAFT_1409416 [Polyporus brumalis]